MSQKHLAVGIHIHASALGLLQQLLQIGQIVTGDQDSGIFTWCKICGGRPAITLLRSTGCRCTYQLGYPPNAGCGCRTHVGQHGDRGN